VQIEDLLTALSEMQRDQSVLANELQSEREEREEDRKVVALMIDQFRSKSSVETVTESAATEDDVLDELSVKRDSPAAKDDAGDDVAHLFERLEEVVTLVEDRFYRRRDPRRSSIVETKHQLREEIKRSKEQYNREASRSRDLNRQVSEQGNEIASLREQLKETRARVQEGHRERQRLEKSVSAIRRRQSSTSPMEAPEDGLTPVVAKSDAEMFNPRASVHGGLREFRLNRTITTPVYAKRTSSLSIQPMSSPIRDSAPSPTNADTLLAELVSSKTAEAEAKQEAEELRGKLDSLRKMLTGNMNAAPTSGHRSNASQSVVPQPQTVAAGKTSASSASSPVELAGSGRSPSHAPAASISSFWGGWGKRSASSTIPETTQT
jgi:hypothetical protein